jgi:predicted Zn finger-like uncharacterized protein
MIVQCAECKTRYRLDPERVPAERIRVRCAQCAAVFAVDGSRRMADDLGHAHGSARPGAASVGAQPRGGAGSSVSGPVRPAVAPAPGRPASGAALGYREIDLGPAPVRGAAPGGVGAPPRATAEPAATVETLPELDFEIERSAGPVLRAPQPRAADSQAGQRPAAMRPAATPTAAPRFGGGGRDAPGAKAATPPAPPGLFAAAPDAPGSKAEPEEAVDPAVRKEQEKARRLARALVSDILVYNREKRDKALGEGTLVQALGHEIKKSWELYKEKVTPEVANSTNHFRDALNEILANGQPIF